MCSDIFRLDAERVIITGSGMQAILQTVQAVLGPGDEAVVVSPVWPNICRHPHAGSRGPHRDPALGWARLAPGVASVRRRGPKTRAVFINTPNNPTGWIMEPDDMRQVRDFARARDVWIIADEVYGQFVYDRPRVRLFRTDGARGEAHCHQHLLQKLVHDWLARRLGDHSALSVLGQV